MRGTLILRRAALPLAASGWDDDHRWKLDEKETLKRTFDAAGSGARKLLVDNIHGFIHVTGSSGSQVQVSIEKHIYADSNEAMAEGKRDVKLDMSQQGNFVRLYEDGPFRNRSRGDRYYGYRVEFEFEIQVNKVAGDFDIHGFNGGVDLEDVSGSGTVQTFNGKVKVAFSKNPAHETQ